MLKPLLLNSYDLRGGAARAAYRLHQGLQRISVPSHMLVQGLSSSDETVLATNQTKCGKGFAKLRPALNALPLKLNSQCDSRTYSIQWLPDTIPSRVRQFNPDLVNLHWICDGYLQIESLVMIGKPLVWTLHDMWAFTGGCHYSQACDRYLNACGSCPQLSSKRNLDLSRWVWKRKSHAWKQLQLTIVTPSQWLKDCVASSSLLRNFPVTVIPNGIDTEQYRPIDQRLARDLLRLPRESYLLLFGSLHGGADPRKGFALLNAALQVLSKSEMGSPIELVVLGASQPKETLELDFRCHYLGRFHDDISLALAYSAADVCVAPSTQENLSNTVLESLACGTPCVTFEIGGMPDLIEHQKNGYMAKPFDAEDLAAGIRWILDEGDRYQQLSEYACQKIKAEFTLQQQAHRYLDLFQETLAKQLSPSN